MSIIIIKDLPESVELDRKAMLAITGGARTRGQSNFRGRTILSGTRIVNYRSHQMKASRLPK